MLTKSYNLLGSVENIGHLTTSGMMYALINTQLEIFSLGRPPRTVNLKGQSHNSWINDPTE